MIPVIDLFAGPGGLGEGFSALGDAKDGPCFKIALSIEKDPIAHRTLRLRSFVRQFKRPPAAYYEFLRREITLDELYRRHPAEFKLAKQETLRATLGTYPASKLDKLIVARLKDAATWVLIGGPPCQAYSLVGRSKIKNVKKQKKLEFEKDHRHLLYRSYLRIIAAHKPPIFVMENVKGMLSSELKKGLIIERIIKDLREPYKALRQFKSLRESDPLEYTLYSLSSPDTVASTKGCQKPQDFVVRCEAHGIPQARHRVILVGVRKGIEGKLRKLARRDPVALLDAIGDLPALRSRLSTGDNRTQWLKEIRKTADPNVVPSRQFPPDLYATMCNALAAMVAPRSDGSEFVKHRSKRTKNIWQKNWFLDKQLDGDVHHAARGHMAPDLRRYYFAASFALKEGRSPTMADFPKTLRPRHENVLRPKNGEVIFKDRFRVQVRNRPATTVTAHISKDGHYFIHPDPRQCRSLTVREAARLQTFPDNYFFVGPRTEQYHQVGNAVPPLLAREIARSIAKLLMP